VTTDRQPRERQLEREDGEGGGLEAFRLDAVGRRLA
jgi:hypothetical protein